MYHYTECGLDNIWLKNGYKRIETADGSGIAIPDMDDLHEAIGRGIVKQAAPITGKEFRFLRIELDLSQKTLGELMGKSDQSIAGWEKGANPVPVLADKAIRDLYMEQLGESPITQLLAHLRDLDNHIEEIRYQLSMDDHWHLDECA